VATSSPNRASRYVRSTKNIVACSLAVIGPLLALVGVLAPPIGLAVVPVLYAVGALATRPAKRVQLAAEFDAEDVEKDLKELQRRIRGRVPADVDLRVKQLATMIGETLPRADALSDGSNARYVLVKMATDYLPSSLQPYLDLPRVYADNKVVADGKTPHRLLCDQLDVLSEQMNEVADAVNRADTDRLLANGRFLAEKFGRGPLDLSSQPQGHPPSAQNPGPDAGRG
jgi:hypothetical protein